LLPLLLVFLLIYTSARKSLGTDHP
jgi:hypothetical protein